ncbi:MAG: hypothetical protein ABI977_02335 [Acidobacteriota bacterium]
MLVYIIASKRVVRVGEKFSIRVLTAQSGVATKFGLTSLSWSGKNTGNAELDKEHDKPPKGGLPNADNLWGPFTIKTPGTYTFVVKGTHTVNGQKFGPEQVVAKCHLEVRNDISYDAQVDLIKGKSGKSAEWQTWMKSNDIRARYAPAWDLSRAVPTTIRLAFHYGGDPVKYNPPWESESQHMDKLNKLAALSFPGIGFDFEFNADPTKTDGLVEVRGKGKISHTDLLAKKLYLFSEPIFHHEFGHFLKIQHHYVEGDPKLTPIFMPPFETSCTMARTSEFYCSGCQTAMHLGQTTGDIIKQLATIKDDFNKRYPKE